MLRRTLQILTALALLAEAYVVCATLFVLAEALGRANMSMAGRPSAEAPAALRVLLVALGLFLLLLVALLAVAAVRGLPLGRWGRRLVLVALPVQWILGAVAGVLMGWGAFASLMVVFVLLLGVLFNQSARSAHAAPLPATRLPRSHAETDPAPEQVP